MLVVVTGGVQSNIARKRDEVVLPLGSYYEAIGEDWARRVEHSQEGAMETGTYAKGVVDAVLRKKVARTLWRYVCWILF